MALAARQVPSYGGDYRINLELQHHTEAFCFTQSAGAIHDSMSIVQEIRGLRLAACKDACVSGSNASVLSALMLSACGKLAEGSAAGALNGPSQWVWGEHEAHTRRATARHTLLGYVIHHASSMFWAVCYEHAFGRSCKRDLTRVPAPRIIAEAAATAAIAYVADYYVAPKRVRPGLKKHLGPAAIFATYTAFGLGLGLTTIARKQLITRLTPSAARSSRAR